MFDADLSLQPSLLCFLALLLAAVAAGRLARRPVASGRRGRVQDARGPISLETRGNALPVARSRASATAGLPVVCWALTVVDFSGMSIYAERARGLLETITDEAVRICDLDDVP